MGWVRLRGILVLIFVLLWAEGVAAQSNAAAAESLSRDAKRLMSEKKFAEACPRLEESQRLHPSAGTLLSLGACYQGWGKVASAWSRYSQAQAAAMREGRKDRAKVAGERMRALAAELPKITIVVPPEVIVPGLEVKLDGIVLTSPAYRRAISGGSGQAHDHGDCSRQAALERDDRDCRSARVRARPGRFAARPGCGPAGGTSSRAGAGRSTAEPGPS